MNFFLLFDAVMRGLILGGIYIGIIVLAIIWSFEMKLSRFFRVLQLGMILGCAICAVLFLAAIVGCATDPTTGKSHFDPATAKQIVDSPAVQAGASALPYGLGALGTAAASLLLGFMAKKQADAHTSAAAFANQTVNTVAQALQQSSQVTLPPGSTVPAPAPAPAAKAA